LQKHTIFFNFTDLFNFTGEIFFFPHLFLL
jgi:hypothetical protein